MIDVYETCRGTHCAPRCQACGGRIRPDLVLFGDAIAETDWHDALTWVGQCDLCLILGSRLAVYPAADLPRRCHERGVLVAVVSEMMPTTLDWIPMKVRGRLEDFAERLLHNVAGQ